MIPSRGLYFARGRIPRSSRQQFRNLSYNRQPHHLRSASQKSDTLLRTAQPRTRSIVPTAAPIIVAGAVRHASWWNPFRGQKEAEAMPAAQPPSQAIQPPPPPLAPEQVTTATSSNPTPSTPPAPAETQFPNLDTITLDDIDLNETALDISNIPEGIGYLKQIGIDYGLGPTSGIQWLLEHLHIYGGLPWWASIAAVAIVIRVVTIPLYIKSSDSMARQNALVSVTQPITDRMTAAQKAGNRQEVAMAWQQLNMIRKRAGVSLTSQFIPMVVQGVIGYCGFKLMRECATLPVPGFTDGGFLWLRDLTITDGYLLMPAIMAATVHMVVRMGGENGAGMQQMPKGMRTFMLWGMPTMIALVTAWQPGAVCVWFAASGLIGIAQGQLLQRPAVRNMLGIAPLYRPRPGEASPSPLLSMMSQGGKPQSEPAPVASAAAAPAGSQPSGATNGKNAAFMQLNYQSPSINTRKSGRTIDANLATKPSNSEMIQPGKIESAPASTDLRSKWQKAKARLLETSQEQLKERQKKAWKRKAEEYEKNAQKRGR